MGTKNSIKIKVFQAGMDVSFKFLFNLFGLKVLKSKNHKKGDVWVEYMILIEELLAALGHVQEHLAGCEGSAVVLLVSAHLVN